MPGTRGARRRGNFSGYSTHSPAHCPGTPAGPTKELGDDGYRREKKTCNRPPLAQVAGPYRYHKITQRGRGGGGEDTAHWSVVAVRKTFRVQSHTDRRSLLCSNLTTLIREIRQRVH